MSTNDSRLAALRDMAAKIRSTVSPILDKDAASTEAREAATQASQAATTQREIVMAELALLASAGAWSVKDVDAAAKMACGDAIGNEALPKSVATFVGEARRAMHPDVRDHFPTLVKLRDEVWEVEKAERKADKDAKTPLMSAFARSYHALVGMMGAVIDGTHSFVVASDVVAFAEARDPALDPKKQADKIASILDQLAAISNTFPDQDLLAGIDTLKAVTADALTKARADLLGRDEARLAAHKLAPLPVATTTVVETSEPNEQPDAPAANPIDAALAEMDLGMAAG